MSDQHTQGAVDLYPSAGIGYSEALIAHQAATQQLLSAHDELVELVERIASPANTEAIALTAANSVYFSRDLTKPTRSIGLFNPPGNPLTVFVNALGSATASDAIPVAAGKLLVLPTSGAEIEVGVQAALGAGVTLFCWLFRYFAPQPAYYGG